MSVPTPARVFGVLLRPRRSEIAVAAALLAYAVYLAWVAPRDLDQTRVLALFLQMFWAARGFRESARRGHFDPLLVATPRRVQLARAHWIASVAPGIVVWLLLASVEYAVRPAEWPRPMGASALIGLGLVSCAAWAISLPLVRYSTGVIWVTALFALAGGGYLRTLRTSFLDVSQGWLPLFRGTAATFVCPVMLLADTMAASSALLILVAALAIVFLVAGHLYIARIDVPLSDPS